MADNATSPTSNVVENELARGVAEALSVNEDAAVEYKVSGSCDGDSNEAVLVVGVVVIQLYAPMSLKLSAMFPFQPSAAASANVEEILAADAEDESLRRCFAEQ